MTPAEKTQGTTDEGRQGQNVRFCVIIPAYQEEERIPAVVRGARRHCEEVIVVDDGSADRTGDVSDQAGALVVRHEKNLGKGLALSSGLRTACERGYEAAITMDGDGQHDPDEIPRFKEAYQRTGIPVLVGNRMADPEGMPWVRRRTNEIMSAILSRVMRQYVPDTQCGYRMYRLDLIPFIETVSSGFAAESEILLHIAARGIRIGAVRVSVLYAGEQSRIRPLRDTIRFFRMLHDYRRRQRR